MLHEEQIGNEFMNHILFSRDFSESLRKGRQRVEYGNFQGQIVSLGEVLPRVLVVMKLEVTYGKM